MIFMEKEYYQQVYQHLFKIVRFFDDPKNDQTLLKVAGVDLDSKLFPLFVAIANTSPTQISSLAKLFNRPVSTISRQVDRLERATLVNSNLDSKDSRVRRIVLSPLGISVNQALSTARLTIMEAALAELTDAEKANFLSGFEKVDRYLTQNQAD